ncbi:hypothetical protein [uncultured Shewanella sp.]|uniref:hypothetical protein n=1 Tax=uncultured Shewanella sp. TaxID=173975 RepID=UPI0026097642|nr:hypothetical protein [uncultured Shewanella sp.]
MSQVFIDTKKTLSDGESPQIQLTDADKEIIQQCIDEATQSIAEYQKQFNKK